jgi:hypothetical protein
VNVYLIFDPCLPSFWWLCTGLHLMIHPLYHALHPNRQLPIGLIILHILWLLHEVPWFVSLGFAILIGRINILLRPLMLKSLASWGLMPWNLMPWSLILGSLISLDLYTRPVVLCWNLLVWAPLSWSLISEPWGESTGVGHARLVRSDGIWEVV